MATKKPLNRKPGDYDYGVLNSIERPKVGFGHDLDANDAWESIKKAAESVHEPDSLKGTGPYRGVVLRVENDLPGNSYRGEVDDASAYSYNEDTETPPALVRVKVRVPELHAHIPPPDAFGDVEGAHHALIELYPTFIGQSDLVPKPAVGDIVWVDFTNKTNFTDPIYIRPVTEQQYFASQMAPVLGTSAFGPCANSGVGAGAAGDSTPSANTSGNQAHPPGARKIPEGEVEIIESTEFPPPTQRKPDLVQRFSRMGLRVKGWVGRLSGNGGREVAIFAPKATDFKNPVELIYWIHGAKSWFSAKTPDFLIADLKNMASQGRNVVLVYLQLPWPGSGKLVGKYGTAGGRAGQVFDGSKGGNFATLNSECQRILSKNFCEGGSLRVDFITVACHSKGGQALKQIARSGQLSQVAPDKITCVDSDYRAFGGNATETIWDNYVSTAGKNVEFNLICISPDRRPDDYTDDKGNQPRQSMQAVMKEKLNTDVGTKQVVAVKANNGGTAFVTYAPFMLEHGALAIKHGISFNGAGPSKQPKNNKSAQPAQARTDQLPNNEASEVS